MSSENETKDPIKKSTRLAQLAFSFFKIGLFTFGGGYGMLSLIDEECVEKRKWITADEMLDITAIAESTPGPIAINCASYTGYRQAGFAGATVATAAVVLPSLIIIYLISLFFDDFLKITLVANAFRGIQAAVGILVVTAALKMMKSLRGKPIPMILMGSACGLMLLLDLLSVRLSTLWLILFSGIVGFALLRGKEAAK